MSICSYAYIELLRKGRDTNYKSFIQGKGNVNKTRVLAAPRTKN